MTIHHPTGRITGFWHPGITVSDLDTSLAFYRDALGLEVLTRRASSRVAEQVWNLPGAEGEVVMLTVPGSDVVIELYAISGVEKHSASARPCDPAHGHICLFVDDAEAVHARVQSLGYASRSGRVVDLPDGPAAGGKAVYLVDPDGFHVELYQRPPVNAG